MTVNRLGWIATLVVLVGGLLACGLPSPAEPTPPYSPTATGPVRASPQAFPSETPREPGREAFTWRATDVVPIGGPHEGWQDYQIALAYENNTGQFRNETLGVPSCGVSSYREPARVLTEDGYTYEFGVGSIECGSPEDCPSPRSAVSMYTGVIPPGFRVRGAILYNLDTGERCTSRFTTRFSVGETLQPATLILPPDRVIGLSDPVSTFGPTDPSARLAPLPAVITMGKIRVTVENAVRTPSGNIAINLLYENPSPATDARVCNPVVAVIDSQGYLSAPVGVTEYWTSLVTGDVRDKYTGYCGADTVPEMRLGPLQTAQLQTCLISNPVSGTGSRYFLVLCGWAEDVEAPWAIVGTCGHQTGGTNLMFMQPDYMESQCQVFELNL